MLNYLSTIVKFLRSSYRSVWHSIAFYPALIGLAYVILAIIALKIDSSGLADTIKERTPYLFIQDYETIRAILSTFIGGVISLTVFSFSMVMVVLSQASSDFSPRLLPSLVSNKRHQIILGIYVGTLLYCTLILLSLGAYGSDAEGLGLSAMLATVMAVFCIGLFIYFINSISKAIQIHNIIDDIHSRCDHYLEKLDRSDKGNEIGLSHISTENWHDIMIETGGYYRGFDRRLIMGSIREEVQQIQIVPYLNQHIWDREAVIRTKEKLTEEQKKNLLMCMEISHDRHEEDKGIGGMIKLMEIAVKAMSPGINDPGTAIDAVIKLGRLLAKFLRFPSMISDTVGEEGLVLIESNTPADELIRILIQPIRFYAKHDSMVMFELIKALQHATKTPGISNENRRMLSDELEALRYDLDKHIENPVDKKKILGLLDEG